MPGMYNQLEANPFVGNTPLSSLQKCTSTDTDFFSQCCALDSRILHLEGFDAGIIMEQSQAKHNGPLKSTLGPCQPILALPCLSQLSETGSMLAWVC